MRNRKNSRQRGNNYERQIAKELREIGYTGVVTSRSESKALDNMKVDLTDTTGLLPCNIQLKKTIKTPDYFAIKEDAPTDKPFIVFGNKQKPTESTFRSIGEVVLCDKAFFYELLKKYSELEPIDKE